MQETLNLLRQFEGFRETPYWDVNAHRTGYGSDTITMADGTVRRVTPDDRATREDAERDLMRRVQTEFMPRAAQSVGQDTFSALPPDQQAALTSIVYNYGNLPGAVAAAVRSGDPSAVATAIRSLGSHNDGINADRRNREAAYFGGMDSPQGYGQPQGTAQPQFTDLRPQPTGNALASQQPPQSAMPQAPSFNALDPAAFQRQMPQRNALLGFGPGQSPYT